MKKTLILALVVITVFSISNFATAQQFDAKVFASLNLCQVDGDDDGSYNHIGLRAGVGSSFSLGANPWRMTVELAYTQKGSHINSADGDIALQYVELPLLLSYTLADNRLRLSAGVAPAVLVAAAVTFGSVDSPEQAAKYKRMDWLPLTAQVSYHFTDHLAIEGRYQNSLLSVYDGAGPYRLWTSNHGAFNRLLTFGIAYTF